MGPIVRWVSEKRLAGKTCCIKTAASNAARIAQAAGKLGISLAGTKFIVGGEPFTEAKRETIHRAGAAATVHYVFSAGGSVGNGCADPLYPDEVHINQHTFAVIPHHKPLNNDGPPIRPLLFTTLLPTDPRLLLNVENGDYGILEERDCGCALQRAGLTRHLRHIRSYEKFTSEGMNYFYGDLFDTLEKILPAEFGGGPGDYQLVEEEDDRGQTRLTLRVHPDVPNLNEDALLRRLHEELAKGSRANEFGAKVWQAAGTLRIRREIPYTSARGKILPLHISRFS
jgi:phenylacetate-coenzyme A ligase PaaK-like adenylate-forming protein